jgi:hypothetical protein
MKPIREETPEELEGSGLPEDIKKTQDQIKTLKQQLRGVATTEETIIYRQSVKHHDRPVREDIGYAGGAKRSRTVGGSETL